MKQASLKAKISLWTS